MMTDIKNALKTVLFGAPAPRETKIANMIRVAIIVLAVIFILHHFS